MSELEDFINDECREYEYAGMCRIINKRHHYSRGYRNDYEMHNYSSR